ncbi:MAG: zinc ribbon domain-containing protein [Thermoplasmatota archaeon]
MAIYPARCPSCGEPNDSGLNFCPVCGIRFKIGVPPIPNSGAAARKFASKDDRLQEKKLRKRAELLALYREKKITREQFDKGMEKLGYSADVDKVVAFKKFIQEQIQAFEKMDVEEGAERRPHMDHLHSEADLPRDRYGNVITDFSVPSGLAGTPYSPTSTEKSTMMPARPRNADRSTSGPFFHHGLIQEERTFKRGVQVSEVTKRLLEKELQVDHKEISLSRHAGDLEWDEDEEETFEIDLDDPEDEGERERSDDDDWEDWDIPLENDEDEEWESWGEEPTVERSTGTTRTIVEFFDDEDEDVFDPLTYRPRNRRIARERKEWKRARRGKRNSEKRGRRNY